MPRSMVLCAPLLCLFVAACPGGKYADLPDAPAENLAAAQSLWKAYTKVLGDKKIAKQPELVARFFSKPLVASLEPKAFAKQIKAAKRKHSAGLFASVKIEAVKVAPDGPLVVIDSKAGEAAIPVVAEDGEFRFAALEAACGDWTQAAKRGPSQMPKQPSLLYIKMLLANEKEDVGDRLRAAVGLAETRYRKEIIKAKKTVEHPIVKLGLGLARVKIDGSDESFVRGFPNSKDGLLALQKADAQIFEEMLAKLTNLGSMVEDPPANEALFKVAAGAPDAMRARMGKALYDMAEASPQRFANAVFTLAKDMENDPALAAYFAEVKNRGGKAPKVKKFLKTFSREGEGPERQLCKNILKQFSKHR